MKEVPPHRPHLQPEDLNATETGQFWVMKTCFFFFLDYHIKIGLLSTTSGVVQIYSFRNNTVSYSNNKGIYNYIPIKQIQNQIS